MHSNANAATKAGLSVTQETDGVKMKSISVFGVFPETQQAVCLTFNHPHLMRCPTTFCNIKDMFCPVGPGLTQSHINYKTEFVKHRDTNPNLKDEAS